MQEKQLFSKHQSSIPEAVGRNAALELQLSQRKSDEMRGPHAVTGGPTSPRQAPRDIFGGDPGKMKKQKKKEKGLPYRSANRAKVRSNLNSEFLNRQMRSMERMQALIDTSTIHYNPTGPGDYTLPSSFGELPPPRSTIKAARADQVLTKKPSFSLGNRIVDSRVYKNNLHSLYSSGAPPLGHYDPVNPGISCFEDKAKLNLIRATRWDPKRSKQSMYGDGSHQRLSRLNLSEKKSNIDLNLNQSIDEKGHSSIGDSVNIASDLKAKKGLQQIIFSQPTTHRPYAIETQTPKIDMRDNNFSSEKRFFTIEHRHKQTVPHVYEHNYSSLKQSRFSVDNSRFSVASKPFNYHASYMSRESATLDVKSHTSSQMNSTTINFNSGGRPLFARDSDKHMTPAPSQYKPDRFIKYDAKTKFNPDKANIPNEIRFKDFEEAMSLPGPGQYGEVVVNQKRKPAYALDRADRKLLKVEKTMAPGPSSYDTTTGLSMCSSQQAMQLIQQQKSQMSHKQSRADVSLITMNDFRTGKKNLFTEESAHDEGALYKPTVHGRNSQGAGVQQMQRTQDMRKSTQHLNQTSQSSFNKMAHLRDSYGQPIGGIGGKMSLAPKIKGGAMPQKKRKTDFPTASELRI